MTKTMPTFEFEQDAIASGYPRVAGVDEVGRGPLAGPVVAAAVVLDPDNIPDGLNDSKQMSKKKRVALYDILHEIADVSIAQASVREIEEHNILRASHIAMVRAISVAAASIVAKVWRDRLMLSLAQQHPGYGWETNQGYPTKEHKAGLKSHGVTLHHRRTFAPVHNILWQEKK